MGMNENEGGNENCKLVHTMGGAGSMAGSILHVIFLAMRAFMVSTAICRRAAAGRRLFGNPILSRLPVPTSIPAPAAMAGRPGCIEHVADSRGSPHRSTAFSW